MQIFGRISDRGAFKFKTEPRSKKSNLDRHFFTFAGKEIFIYIEGNITKLSNEIIELTNNFNSIAQKISYLYYIGFNFEKHLCGSFNIFLFDCANKKLKIVRDSRATRSIFYAFNERDFIFSSDQSLIINSIKDITLNKTKMMEFLNRDYVSNKNTYFNEIFRIPQSHYLSYQNNLLTLKKYSFSKSLFKNYSNNSTKETFKKFFFNSVTRSLKKDKKIGVMMSGGLDSSAITIALKENNFGNVYTYSSNFHHVNDSKYEHESKYQKNVSEVTSYLHTPIQMEGKSPIRPIKKFTKIFNQPISVPNIYIFDEIAKKLQGDGIQIILDGNDGDTTVSHGFEVLFYYIKRLKLIKFTKEAYLYSRFKKTSFRRMLFVLIKQALKEIFNIKSNEKNHTLLNKDIAIKKNPKNNLSYYSTHEQKLSNDLHIWGNEFRNTFFRHYDIDNYSPFYDEELINFCLNMPLIYKLDKGFTRKVLRDFLSEYLPDDHVKRDKSILTSGLLKNFTITDLEIVKEEYTNANQTLLNLIDRNKINQIISSLESGKKINENELIALQMFVSANTFLNDHKF